MCISKYINTTCSVLTMLLVCLQQCFTSWQLLHVAFHPSDRKGNGCFFQKENIKPGALTVLSSLQRLKWKVSYWGIDSLASSIWEHEASISMGTEPNPGALVPCHLYALLNVAGYIEEGIPWNLKFGRSIWYHGNYLLFFQSILCCLPGKYIPRLGTHQFLGSVAHPVEALGYFGHNDFWKFGNSSGHLSRKLVLPV